MEIGLSMDTMTYFKRLTDAVFEHEETMELVVPDTLPDVAEVADAFGVAILRTKEARADGAFASGMVQGCVLYRPEGEKMPRGFEVSVPWNFTCDCPGMDTSGKLSIRAELTGLEARVINSRKIVVRASLNISVRAYMPAEASWCSGADECAEVLRGEHTLMAATDVTEKTFSITEEAELPASKPPIGRILGCRAALTAEEVRPAGRRLLLVGRAEVEVIYSSQMSGELAGATFSIPYSQVLELLGDDTEPDCEAVVTSTGVYVKENAGQDATIHSVNIELAAVAQLVVRREMNISCVSDLYCTAAPTELDTGRSRIDTMTASDTYNMTARETFSCDERVKSVLSCRVTAGRAIGDGTTLRVPLRVAVLCSAEDGHLMRMEGRMEASAAGSVERGDCISVSVSDAVATPTAGGVEVRASVTARVRRYGETELKFVSAVHDVSSENTAAPPSIVVARAAKGDNIWSIAKRYRSTQDSIRQSNNMEPEAEIAAGDLLIITKCV